VKGASWIATRRVSKPGLATALELRVKRDARAAVFVMASADGRAAQALTEAGFADAEITGWWRDNDLALVRWRLFRRPASGGETVRVPALSVDAVVLVKPDAGV
jgi:hypothetical protein